VSVTVVWCGPFSPKTQAPGATVQGAALGAIVCKGAAGGPSMALCPQLAQKITTIDDLLRIANVPASDTLVLASFSAGHNIVRPLMLDPANRARVDVLYLADSIYGSWKNQEAQTINVPDGYVDFAIDALDAKKLFVATSSNSPNSPFPNGEQSMKALAQAIESRAGQPMQEASALSPEITPQPVGAGQLGGTLFCDYGGLVTHPEHATKLAPQFFQKVVSPWLEMRSSAAPKPITVASVAGSDNSGLVTLAAGTALALLLMRLVGKRA
jgi:hypothetical protein